MLGGLIVLIPDIIPSCWLLSSTLGLYPLSEILISSSPSSRWITSLFSLYSSLTEAAAADAAAAAATLFKIGKNDLLI